VLIAARVLQGVGGALLTPGALAILEASFYPGDRARAIGAWSGLAGIGGALGPFLGGWLVQIGTWRLVFLINVPLAALVVAVALRHVPESRDPDAARRLDITGVLTGAAGLAGLTYGFTAWPALSGTSRLCSRPWPWGLGGWWGSCLPSAARVVLVHRPGRQQPDPGTELGLDIQHPLTSG
jgi:MFS family permease